MLLMISTVRYVYSVEIRSSRVFAKAKSKNSNDSMLSRHSSVRIGRSYSKRVATQSFCYLVAFFITWTPLATVRVIQFAGGTVPKWLLCFGAFFTPFQGFLNSLVYFRPRIVKYRRKHVDYNCCKIFSSFCLSKLAHFRRKSSAIDRASPENESAIGV